MNTVQVLVVSIFKENIISGVANHSSHIHGGKTLMQLGQKSSGKLPTGDTPL
jgi:hypothetical protein